jgi:hypothetical protein
MRNFVLVMLHVLDGLAYALLNLSRSLAIVVSDIDASWPEVGAWSLIVGLPKDIVLQPAPSSCTAPPSQRPQSRNNFVHPRIASLPVVPLHTQQEESLDYCALPQNVYSLLNCAANQMLSCTIVSFRVCFSARGLYFRGNGDMLVFD